VVLRAETAAGFALRTDVADRAVVAVVAAFLVVSRACGWGVAALVIAFALRALDAEKDGVATKHASITPQNRRILGNFPLEFF
jgi:hypothetical protein